MNYLLVLSNIISKLEDFVNDVDTKLIALAFIVLLFVLILILVVVFLTKHSHKTSAELRELDYLTKIYNRGFYYKKCSEFLTTTDSKYAMIAFDINKFKLVNEYYGTEEADKLLIDISNKLLEFYKNGQITIFGRIESDKFSWIMPDDRKKIEKVFDGIDRIREKLKYVITFNIGIYSIESNKMDVEQAYSRANLASKSIKGNFEKTIAYFDRDMIQKLKNEQFIVDNIDDAIKNEDILVYFQPKYDLQENQVCGAEALVRWNHPEQGMIPPSEFVPALENHSLITKLDKYIWERTARYLAKWCNEGLNPYPVSINISKVDLLEVDLPEYIEGLVRKYNIPHNLLELEITESAYVDGDLDVSSIIKKFKNKGFTILMDDFGSGYSSLNTLREFPIDVLKIDLKFLSGFENGNKESLKGKTIIESIVTMAKHLNLEIVVEGTETIDQVEYIRSIGCEIAQGYFFSKPLSADEYIKYIKEGRKLIPNSTFSSRATEDSIWNKNMIVEDFFNQTVCGLGIFIYRRGRMEASRLNEVYFDLVESNRKDFYSRSVNVLESVHSEDLNIVLSAIEEVINTKSSKTIKYRHINSNGNIKWFLNKITYINSTDPTVNYFFTSIYDITNEHNLDIDMSDILNSLSYPYLKVDLDTRQIYYYNEMLLKIVGLNKEDFELNYQRNYTRLFKNDEIDKLLEDISRIEIGDQSKLLANIQTQNGYLPINLMVKTQQVSSRNYAYFSITRRK